MWEKHLWQGIYPAPSKALQKDRQTRNSPAGGCSLKAWRRTNFSALPFMVFLVVMALGAVGIDLTAKASDTGVAAEDTALDYRLAPGDRLTVVVFDQPQLSGDLIIDGRGEILLPLAGVVHLSGLTLAEAQQLIQQRFTGSALVQPSVFVNIGRYRPIFVTGYVKKPGSYPFIFGETVKAATATAGGEGHGDGQPLSVAVSDFIAAEERVRQLEKDHATLLVRQARLEAQRDERDFSVFKPQLVGLNHQNVDLEPVYSAENDMFVRLESTYRDQVQALTSQRPLIDAELKAVTDQITAQKERLEIVTGRLFELEDLFKKGNLTKTLLLNQQIEKTLVQSQVSALQAEVVRLRREMGELDEKLINLKAAYEKQILQQLQATSQRLHEVETSSWSGAKHAGGKG